ncbi:hypothetical protein [Streptomyces fractus]|uniref:hypothetical protein n=1 Tax=Streptomyces fractus TaxID=641806 RepID=UPI003CF39841
MIIGRRVGRAARSSRLLLVGCLLAVGCWSAAGPSAADGATVDLGLDVTVNTRPGLGALSPGIRTGTAVVKSYRLSNHGSADLHDVRVRDPAMPGARIRCPGGRDRVPLLTGQRSARCTATGTARPGTWIGKATADGRQPYLRSTAHASARSGYAGVGAAPALSESARVTGPDRAVIRYAVTNTGNRPLQHVRVSDPEFAADRIDCGDRRPVVPRLAAGATAECTAEVRRGPGRYLSRGRAEGSDLLRTLDTRGARVAAPRLVARAETHFTLPAAPPTKPTSNSPARRPPKATAPVPRPPGGPPEALEEPPAPVAPPAAALMPLAPPPLGVAPPGVAPPGVHPVTPGRTERPPTAAHPPPRTPEQPTPQGHTPEQHTLLSRFVRPDHTPTGLGLMTALFLVLLPAAVAAAVLGSRRH